MKSKNSPGTNRHPVFRELPPALAAAAGRGGRRVVLPDGEYRLARPLRLGPRDSGLVVEAARGAHPVLSGVRAVAGWRREKDGLWSAPVPWVTARAKGFRSLFVDGEARPRSRWPKRGAFFTAPKEERPKDADWETWAWRTDHRRIALESGAVDPAWDLSCAEAIFYHFWVDSHVPAKGVAVEDGHAWLELAAPLRRTPSEALFCLENVRDAIAEGEWALDWRKKRVFYRPRPGEDLARAEVTVPSTERLLEIDGAEGVVFRGVAFAGSRFELPDGERNDFQASAAVSAAVVLRGARRCRFERCRFEDLAGYAADLLAGTRDCAFSRCTLRRLGAGGIRLDAALPNWRAGRPEDPLRDTAVFDPRRRVAGNEIADCEIADYGRDFPSAVGVLLLDAEGTRVHHNHIHDGYYTGVSCGWVWGYLPSAAHGNDIAFNHIHDIGKGLLSDMGGIYTLGVSSGTRIRNNLVHGIDARVYGGWGLYNDEGSTGILVENNVVFDTKFSCYHMHYGRDCIVRNNVFGGGRLDQICRSRREPHISFVFYNNVVYWTEGKLHSGDWDDKEDYTFPFHVGRTRLLRKTVECDWNLYFNPRLPLRAVHFGPGLAWSDWRARGQDVHSRWGDPKFADPARGDFSLAPDSPAFALGFRPIDLSQIGPRRSRRRNGG